MVNDIVGGLGAPLLGGLIASQRPENPYGWLWLGIGASFALATFAPVYAAYALQVVPGSLPAPRTVASLGLSEGYAAIITLGSFLFLLFPNGRLPSRCWRPLAWSIVAVGVVLIILATFADQPAERYRNPSP
jgi:MFS family permease